jgi:hypothetical protein
MLGFFFVDDDEQEERREITAEGEVDTTEILLYRVRIKWDSRNDT